MDRLTLRRLTDLNDSELRREQAMETINHRIRGMLRAVAAGRAEITLSSEPDLFVDGLPCSDQFTAHRMAVGGLIQPSRPGLPGQRVPATVTAAGTAALTATRAPATAAA